MADANLYGPNSPTAWTNSGSLANGDKHYQQQQQMQSNSYTLPGYYHLAAPPTEFHPSMSSSYTTSYSGQHPRIGQTASSENFAANGPIAHGASFESHTSHNSGGQVQTMMRATNGMPNVSPVVQTATHQHSGVSPMMTLHPGVSPMVQQHQIQLQQTHQTHRHPGLEQHGGYQNVQQQQQQHYYYNPPQHQHPGQAYTFFSQQQQQQHQPHTHPQQIWSSGGPVSSPHIAVEYVTDLRPNDVLSGRGGATNSYKGNRAFRAFVKEFQVQYFNSSKANKPKVADMIVDLIRKKGGRFLTKAKGQTHPQGLVLWYDIGAKAANEKTCQALRENAPELRKLMRTKNKKRSRKSRSRSSSFESKESKEEEQDDVEDKQRKSSTTSASSSLKDNTDATPLSSPSTTIDRINSGTGVDAIVAGATPSFDGARWSKESYSTEDTQTMKHSNAHTPDKDLPVLICPWERLLPNRPLVEPFRMDTLTPLDQELYHDFFPPSHDGGCRNNAQSELGNFNDHTSSECGDSKPPAAANKPAAWPLVSAS